MNSFDFEDIKREPKAGPARSGGDRNLWDSNGASLGAVCT